LSYYAGSQLAGVSFGYGTVPTMLGLGLLWAILFPVMHWIARQLGH
jgi:sulfite exporter TauE/SafE